MVLIKIIILKNYKITIKIIVFFNCLLKKLRTQQTNKVDVQTQELYQLALFLQVI